MKLGSRTFTDADQWAFAVLSGDRNPMHMDGIAARRTQMGATVVHGVHGLLWALDLACGSAVLDIRSIKVNFAGPIYVGDTATVILTARSETQVRLQVVVDGAPCTTVSLALGLKGEASAPEVPEHLQPATWPEHPRELAFSDLATEAGAFALVGGGPEIDAAFPHLSRAVSAERVSALASLSRVVGMVCPGLHSIFSGLSIDLVEGDLEPVMRFRTVEADERFLLVRLTVAGSGVAGELKAFSRLPPVAQPGLAEMASSIPQGAYASATVLVIGGSRGLGEVAAKACAAGGARVIVTYAVGRDEAERVADEIRRAGGMCDVLRLDARSDIAVQLTGLPATPTHLYYFATGPIALRRTRLLSPEVLAEFMRFYTTAFLEACEAVSALAAGAPLRVFYPSSVAVEEAPKGWVEYSMAKAAGEILCREMNLHAPGVTVVMHRLPRILTDQTATVRSAAAAPILDVMLPIVREMQQV